MAGSSVPSVKPNEQLTWLELLEKTCLRSPQQPPIAEFDNFKGTVVSESHFILEENQLRALQKQIEQQSEDETLHRLVSNAILSVDNLANIHCEPRPSNKPFSHSPTDEAGRSLPFIPDHLIHPTDIRAPARRNIRQEASSLSETIEQFRSHHTELNNHIATSASKPLRQLTESLQEVEGIIALAEQECHAALNRGQTAAR